MYDDDCLVSLTIKYCKNHTKSPSFSSLDDHWECLLRCLLGEKEVERDEQQRLITSFLSHGYHFSAPQYSIFKCLSSLPPAPSPLVPSPTRWTSCLSNSGAGPCRGSKWRSPPLVHNGATRPRFTRCTQNRFSVGELLLSTHTTTGQTRRACSSLSKT